LGFFASAQPNPVYVILQVVFAVSQSTNTVQY